MSRTKIYVSSPLTAEDKTNAGLAVADEVWRCLEEFTIEKPPSPGDHVFVHFDFRFV